MEILSVDDHSLFRSGLKFILSELDPKIKYHEAESCSQAIELFSDQQFDIVLLDYYLPGSSSEQNISHINQNFSHAKIVVISGEEDAKNIIAALELGVSGFIPKSSKPDVLIAALKLVLAGGVYLPTQVLMHSNSAPTVDIKDEHSVLDRLSERQLEVLFLAMDGNVNKTIAKKLDLSVGTVKAHLSAAYRALGVTNRTQALCVASQINLKKTK